MLPNTLYDSHIEWHSPELAALVASGALPPGRALDLGCGAGTEALFLARHGWDVTGVEKDPSTVAYARSRVSTMNRIRGGKRRLKIRFLCSDAVRYRDPRGSGRYSVVLERLLYTNFFPDGDDVFRKKVAQWEAKRRLLLRTAAAALAPGGVFVMRLKPILNSLKDTSDTRIPVEDQRFLDTHFRSASSSSVKRGLGGEIGYVGIATDPLVDGATDGGWVVRPIDLSIVVWVRNDSKSP